MAGSSDEGNESTTAAGEMRSGGLPSSSGAPDEAASRLLAILGRIGDGIVALDSEWRCTYVNEAAATILRRSDPGDLIGKRLWTESPTDIERAFRQACLEAFEAQRTIALEEYVAPRDSWIEGRVFPAADGLTIRLSERTTGEQAGVALRRAAAVFANTEGAVVTTDTAFVVTSANRACLQASGFAESEVLGRHASVLFDVDANGGDRYRLETEPSWSEALPGKRKDGTSYPQFVSKVTLLDTRGKAEGNILIASDPTAPPSGIGLEQQLARAQRMEAIGNLTGGIAHDFNNHLAAILGNLEMIRDETINLDGSALQIVCRIDAAIEAAARGADLHRNVLGFARRAPLAPTPLHLNDIVERTAAWIGRTIRTNIRFNTVLGDGLPLVEIDDGAVESALLNLILNARDAMPGGGTLTIETAEVHVTDSSAQALENRLAPGHYVRLTVADTGVGIAEGVLERIFEPFFSTKAPGGGSGLGLSMVRETMRRSGGSVEVHSELGSGTAFHMYFKASLSAPSMPDGKPAAWEDGSSRQRHILVAEDDAAVRGLIAEFLETAGHQVTTTGSADDAIRAFRAAPTIDLLLTDVAMPGRLQGPTLARELRASSPALPVIFVSGYASEAAAQGEGIERGDIQLMKPFRKHELIMAVRRALAGGSDDIERS